MSLIFETVWIGCGNSELWTLSVLAKFIDWVESCEVFEYFIISSCDARGGADISVGGGIVVFGR